MVPGRSLRILVVDDNIDAADLLGALLESLGHQVAVAHDGARGLAQFESFAPDMAILDLGLPEIDGFELATIVRGQERFRSIPLIALSGYSQPADRERSRASGFTYHLAKPAELAQLTQIIDSHFSGRGR